MDVAAMELDELQQRVCSAAQVTLQQEKNILQSITARLPVITLNRIEQHRSQLQFLGTRFPVAASNLLSRNRTVLDHLQQRLRQTALTQVGEASQFIRLTEQFIKLASPDYILQRGYSLTLKEGEIIKKATQLSSGDRLVTRFADGEVYSKVE